MKKNHSKQYGLIFFLVPVLVLFVSACSEESNQPKSASQSVVPATFIQPSVLLVTLDTTRADSTGIETNQVATPHLKALADRGVYFDQAYSVTPTTLPAHTSMMTGLYPADHRVRENGRPVDKNLELLPAKLKEHGYTTAAFVSGYPLAGEFGLSRGFAHYDDAFVSDAAERPAGATTDAAVSWLNGKTNPFFMWVHYFDAHDPYEPPEPFLSRYPDAPYLGEIAYMDQEFGRLVAAFEAQTQGRPWKIIVVGDHGEGLGDHGEVLHGNLLYQATMRVPLIVAGSSIEAATSAKAVSVRQVFDTVLGWSGESRDRGLLGDQTEPVLAEALKPYMHYGWQPQFMAIMDGIKVISSGVTEIYDVRNDPQEINNLDEQIEPQAAIWDALEDYSIKALAEQAQDKQQPALSQEALDKLASLGYIGTASRPKVRDDAPSPKDMVHLYHDMDVAAGLFLSQDYATAIPVLNRILESDPNNFMTALRLAVAYSVTGDDPQAMMFFERAREIDSSSADLRHYQALHYIKTKQWDLAQPLFESVLAESPERVNSLAGLAKVYTSQGELNKAIQLMERIVKIKDSPGIEWTRLGQLRMKLGDTKGAIRAFEIGRKMLGDQYTYHLELGVLYMADGRFKDAATSLDKVSRLHPAYAMALYKRAQTSALLDENDLEHRVRQAWQRADRTTRPLIENEQLFQGVSFR